MSERNIKYALRYHLHDYKQNGYLMDHFRLYHHQTKGVVSDYHYHEFFKLLLLISGSGEYVVDGQRYNLQAGDLILVPCDSVHRPELNSNVDYERVILYMDAHFLTQESTDDCDLAACFDVQNGHVLRLDAEQYQCILALTAQLEQEMSIDQCGHQVASKAKLLELLVLLRRYQTGGLLEYAPPVQPKNDRILDVLQFMETHLCEDLDIDRLADRFFVSKYHLMRLFHRETGSTIHGYLTQRRLLTARDLIRQGVSATDACYRSGFRSYSSFTRAYGKHFGTSPTGKKDPSIVKSPDYE